MLHVLLPVAFILRSRFIMNIDPVAISFIIFPLSFIVISIGMRELALAFSFIVDPLSLVECTVWPFLFSEAIAHVAQPFALIIYPIFEPNQRFSFTIEPIVAIIVFLNEHIAVIHLFLMDLLQFAEFLVYFEDIAVVFFFRDVLAPPLGLDLVRLLLFDGGELGFFEFVAEGFWDVVADVLAGACIAHGS